MTNIPPHHEDYLPGSTFPATAVPSGAAVQPALTVLQPPLSPRLLPHWHPVPRQSHDRAGVPQNIMFPPSNAAAGPGNRWPEAYPPVPVARPGEDVPRPIENIAVRAQPQDLGYIGINYYDVNNYPLPPPAGLAVPLEAEYRDHGIGVSNYARVQVPQGVPIQAHAIARPIPEIDIFDNAGQHAVAGPAQALVDEWNFQAPVFDEPATEILHRLANHCLNQLDSQVDTVRMEPSPRGRIRVVITLELADLL